MNFSAVKKNEQSKYGECYIVVNCQIIGDLTPQISTYGSIRWMACIRLPEKKNASTPLMIGFGKDHESAIEAALATGRVVAQELVDGANAVSAMLGIEVATSAIGERPWIPKCKIAASIPRGKFWVAYGEIGHRFYLDETTGKWTIDGSCNDFASREAAEAALAVSDAPPNWLAAK